MIDLIVLCGPAFSGKTTLALRLQDELGYAIVSADRIMAETKPKPPCVDEDWSSVHRTALSRVQAHMEEGRRVVVDDTACFRFLRDNYRRLAAEAGKSFRVLTVRLSDEEIWARAYANRENPVRHDVADDVLARHLATFEWPTPDEEALDVTSRIGDLGQLARV